MSMEEFDKMDNQVMDVVNDHATPEAVEAAESIAKQASSRDPEEEVAVEMAKARVRAEEKRRQKECGFSILRLLFCVIVAGALIFVLINPQHLIWIINAGLAICCTVAGITVDRLTSRNHK